MYVCEESEIVCPIVGELAHIYIILATADISKQGYCQKIGKSVSTTSCNPMVWYFKYEFLTSRLRCRYNGCEVSAYLFGGRIMLKIRN